MPLETDFDPQTAAQMREELNQYADKCYYDESKRKIVYYKAQDAFVTYIRYQLEAMNRHKWIESEKSKQDLGLQAMAEWVHKYSDQFANYWRRTHVYIPSQDHTEEA